MTTSLKNLVDNLRERIHKIKCKDWDCFLKYQNVKDSSIKYKYLSCNKDYSNKIEKNERINSSFIIMI